MFIQARALYIIGNNVGNAAKIDEDLSTAGIKNRFFNSNPSIFSNREYINFLNKLPPECVFAVKSNSSFNSNESAVFIISIPFVSSHLGLAVKVGETIWLQENNIAKGESNFYSINGFYLGRAHSYFTSEDVSYCYDSREENIFKSSRKSFAESNITKNNVYDKMKNIKQENIRKHAVYSHDFNIRAEESKFVSNSNIYFKDKINSYSLKPTSMFIKNPEDVAVRGTYNTLVSLTSEVDNYSKDTRYGSIELVAGYGEYSKKNVEYVSLSLQDSNNNALNKKTELLKFESDIAGLQIHNGIHYETIKSNMSFVNEGLASSLNLNKYENNYLTSKYRYDRDAASFSISEYNLRNLEINKYNKLNIQDIQDFVYENNTQGSLLDNNKFIVHTVPKNYPDIESSNIVDIYSGGSSLSGVADSIIFCTHYTKHGGNEDYNNIRLIQSNSDDNLSSQIALNSSGNILIDGHKILIGSYDRLRNKKNGKSALVYLGNSDTSQSVVLGEQLNQVLEEIVTVQKTVFVLLKQILMTMNESDTTSHAVLDQTLQALQELSISGSMLPPLFAPVAVIFSNLLGGIAQPIMDNESLKNTNSSNETFIKEKILTNKNNDSTELYIKKLENIVNNLDKQLSKFVKTSWNSLLFDNYY